MNTSSASVRPAIIHDSPTIAEFNVAMAQETEALTLDRATVRAGVESLFKRPELGFYLVAEQRGALVASLMITTEWSDWRNGLFWWIQSVYVTPSARRQGIFTLLYRHVESLAEMDSGICGFRLYVEQGNQTAQSVYRSLGMQETHYRLFEALRK